MLVRADEDEPERMKKARKPVYLDYSATTPLRPEVGEAMARHQGEAFGNPSSVHALGREARVAVEDSRRRLLEALGVSGGRLVFTGSGSEADNLALLGFARRNPGGCVVRSSIEHKAVIEATRALQAAGYEVRVAPVDGRGVVDVDALSSLLPADGRPTLVAVMWANNETGVIQPVESVARLCESRGATLFCDAVQAFGKVPLRLEAVKVGMLAVSAHKIGGPKGVGALLIRGATELEPLVYGGGQEGGLRSGTENVAGIVGFARAAELAVAERAREAERLGALRDRLESGFARALPELTVNGGDAPERLPNVLNVSIPGIDIEGTLTALDLEGVCVSSGSACTTGAVEASHVLEAMGRAGDAARNTIRLSLGFGTTPEDIDYALATLPRVVQRVREFAQRTGG